MAKKKKLHYVNKGEMLTELRHYKATGEISEFLGSMFWKIAYRYSRGPKFCRYTYIDDMVSSAVERMISQIHKFDPERADANPFAYFTRTAHNQFLAVLKKEKKERLIKQNYREKIWDDLCAEELINPQNLNPSDDLTDNPSDTSNS